MIKPTISIIGCGWLGFPLASFLLTKGYKVNGSTTRIEKMPHLVDAGIHAFLVRLPANGEMTEEMEKELIACLQADILIVNIPPGRKNPNVEQEHPQQMRYLINHISKSTIQKVIFISSTSVYHPQNTTITEHAPTEPIRGSGKALVQVEKLFQANKSFQTTILRMSGLYGGERHPGRFLAGKQNLPNGDAPVNLVHRDDCVGIIEQVMVQKKWGEIYNVCADKHPTKREMYTNAAKKLGLAAPHFTENGSLSYNLISNEKVKRELAYSFRYSDPMNDERFDD